MCRGVRVPAANNRQQCDLYPCYKQQALSPNGRKGLEATEPAGAMMSPSSPAAWRRIVGLAAFARAHTHIKRNGITCEECQERNNIILDLRTHPFLLPLVIFSLRHTAFPPSIDRPDSSMF